MNLVELSKSNHLDLKTCSFILYGLIHIKSSKIVVRKYINKINGVVSSTHSTHSGEWYDSKDSNEKILINESIKELASFKYKLDKTININDYLHYIYGLFIALDYLNNNKYIFCGSQLLLSLCEQALLDEDILPTTIINLYICLLTYIKNLNDISHIPSAVIYIKLLEPYVLILNPVVEDIIGQTIHFNKWEIGELLVYTLKVRKLLEYSKHKETLYNLYDFLIKTCAMALTRIKFLKYSVNNDAYQWFNICIGLEAINILHYNYTNDFITRDKYYIKIRRLREFYRLKHDIITNFKIYSFNKGNWRDNVALNSAVYWNTRHPILFI